MEPQNPQNDPVNSLPNQTPQPTQAVTQPAPTGTVAPAPVQPVTSPIMSFGSNSAPKSKKKISLVIIIVGIISLLAAVSAAAYYAVVVPNKPENKLALAFGDLANHNQVSISGKYDITEKKSDSVFGSVSVDYNARFNFEKSLVDISGDVGVKGVTIPFALRSVEQDIYFKIEGTAALAGIARELDPLTADLYAGLLESIDNQWYVIDRSLYQQDSSAACIADINYKLTDEDSSLVQSAYKKHPLFSVKGTSSEDVDGVATTKYELNPASDEEAKKFANELSELSVVKKIKECSESENKTDSITDDIASANDTTATAYAYVTADKQLKKIEVSGEDETSTFKFTMNFDFSDFDVEKPEGAKPIQEILTTLYGSYGGSALGAETQFETLLD